MKSWQKPGLGRLINFIWTFLFLFSIPVQGQQHPTKKKKDTGEDSKMNNQPDTLIRSILERYPQFFDAALKNRDSWGIQVIYTRIDRDKKGKPRFTDHTWNQDSGQYFYPASSVKLPVAILALQRLNELKIPGLDRNSTMITGKEGNVQTSVQNDPTAADGRPTIAHYIKKILLVSDNDAFNRLYEFLGQEYINTTLHRMGYTGVQIIHRLEVSLNEAQNRHTNPVSFYDTTGKLLYEKPAAHSKLVYATRNTRMGKGFYRNGVLINEPFDFSAKNRLPLYDLHRIVQSILFPDAVPKEQRFNLTDEDYRFLRRYMSMLPAESKSPVYSEKEYWPHYVKFLYYGSETGRPEESLRIFNKVGDAYGFLIDGAYFADFENRTEFFLSAVIHCNSDGIYNDDKYDYDSIGFPFLKNLGKVIAEYDRSRKRKHLPDLSAFLFDYRE